MLTAPIPVSASVLWPTSLIRLACLSPVDVLSQEPALLAQKTENSLWVGQALMDTEDFSWLLKSK